MWDRINKEILNHCSQCPDKESCQRQKCVVYRIKNITLAIFDSSKVNIDDFFDTPDKKQISIFDYEGEE